MKTTVKKTYNKKRRRASKATFNYIASHYFRTKITTNFRIQYDSSGVKFVPANADRFNISNNIAESDEWKTFRNMFLSYKLTGLSVVITPLPGVPAIITSQTNTGVFPLAVSDIRASPYFGIISSYGDITVKTVSDSDKSVLLSFTDPVTKYWKFDVAEWANSSAPNEVNGRFAVAVDANTESSFNYWQVKCTYYITFRVKV